MLNQALRLPMQDHGWQKRSGELSADCNYPWWTIRSVNWSTPTCWEILSGHKGWTVSLVDIFAFFHMYFSLFMHVSCHMCMWIYSPAVSWPHILCLHCNRIQDPTDPLIRWATNVQHIFTIQKEKNMFDIYGELELWSGMPYLQLVACGTIRSLANLLLHYAFYSLFYIKANSRPYFSQHSIIEAQEIFD